MSDGTAASVEVTRSRRGPDPLVMLTRWNWNALAAER